MYPNANRTEHWRTNSLPPVLQAQRSRDHGLPFHPWIRLNHALLGFAHPIVMLDLAELRLNGYTPLALGMDLIGDHGYPFTAPVLPVIADLKSRYDLDLFEADPMTLANPVFMLGGTFEDPHSDEWWDEVRLGGQLLVMAGDTPLLAEAVASGARIDVPRLMAESYLGRVARLTVRAPEVTAGAYGQRH